MKKQKNMFQTREQDKQVDIINLLDKVFKIMVIKMLNEVRRTTHGQSENFNKEIGKYKEVPSRNHRAEEFNY